MPSLNSAKKEPLPRADRAMCGWRRLTPGKMRLPIPRSVAGAIAGFMIDKGVPEMGIRVLLCFVAMLGPGECLRLAPWSIVASAPGAEKAFDSWGLILNAADLGVPGKTGLCDELVPLDLGSWIHRPRAAVAQTRAGSQSLWPFRDSELREQFNAAPAFFGAQHVGAHLYSFRRGGASYDLLTRRRSAPEVKGMGRRLSDVSLRRYGKATRLQAPVGATLEDQIRYKVRAGSLLSPLPGAAVLQAAKGGRGKPKRARG